MKHGMYWMIQEGQDTSLVYTDYGTQEPDDKYSVSLKTEECYDEFWTHKERWNLFDTFNRNQHETHH